MKISINLKIVTVKIRKMITITAAEVVKIQFYNFDVQKNINSVNNSLYLFNLFSSMCFNYVISIIFSFNSNQFIFLNQKRKISRSEIK